MQPNQPDERTSTQTTSTESIIAPLHKVTPVSKYLALALFIALPFVGGVVGYTVALNPAVDMPVRMEPIAEATSDDSVTIPSASLQVPENSYLKSARTEIMKGYYTKKVIPNEAVMGNIPEGDIFTCDAFVITEGDVSALYTTDAQGELVSLTQEQLPYTILIREEATWPWMWAGVLLTSSSTNQIYAAVTDIVSYGGKGLDTCEPSIEGFVPFTAN